MATTRTLKDMVAEVDPETPIDLLYRFRDDRLFYAGSTDPYADNAMGIGYMAVDGTPGTRFVVVPAYTGEELFAWLRANQ